DVANPGRELMPQMSAQVFFVLSGAYDVVTVPVAALRYTDRPARGAGRRQGGQNPSNEAQQAAGAQPETTEKPTRPREVTVVHDDGIQEIRKVQVGVTDRVNAEIVSGLSEGERVVVGTETPESKNAKKGNGDQKRRAPVLFGG